VPEHFGSEPPGDGWVYAGDGRWIDPLFGADARGPRVAVVGGGPGGMFATYILNQKLPDARVTLFESSSRLGGKILTDRFSDGTRFEAGVAELYEYLGPGGRDPLRQLIEEDLGLRTTDMSGGGVILRGEVVRDLGDLGRLFGEETRKCVERFHRKVARLMPLEKYANRWQPDNDHPWAGKTFEECLCEEIPDDEVARAYITTACHSDLATEPHTCNGLNALKNILMDNPEYLKLYHVTGGIDRVTRRLAERLRADVRKRTRVTRVGKLESGEYRVHFRKGLEEGAADFDAVLVALPNHWLTQVCWGDAALAAAIQRTCAHYDLPAHYLRVTCRFATAWWQALELPGDYWMLDTFNGCCVYDERHRWPHEPGNVLSFLLGGQDALLLCAADQDDQEVVQHLLHSLPLFLARPATEQLVEAQVDRFAGSLNAQPGGWPAHELRGEHVPEPEGHPGLFLVGDYLFDSTLNAALMSANTAVDLLLEHLGVEAEEPTPAVKQLEPDGKTL
jgi:monoamine oxidase